MWEESNKAELYFDLLLNREREKIYLISLRDDKKAPWPIIYLLTDDSMLTMIRL